MSETGLLENEGNTSKIWSSEIGRELMDSSDCEEHLRATAQHPKVEKSL